MPALPPLILALQPVPGSPRTLVAVRDAEGPVQAGFEAWPEPVPAGALFLHWPARFAWTAPAFRCRGAVRDAGGADFPLATVLSRLGVHPGRGAAGLTSALAPELAEVTDPSLWARRLVETLAERLAGAPDAEGPEAASSPPAAAGGASAGAVAEAPGGTRPHPALRDALATLPDRPGVYLFLDADGGDLYVGKARSLARRVPRHFGPRPAEPEKSGALAARARGLRWTEAGSELEALLLEQLRLLRDPPPVNTVERAHRRERGAWREARTCLVLPSAAPRSVEVCLLDGTGRLHWERAPRRARVPRALWARVAAFPEAEAPGRAPGGEGGEGGDLSREEEGALTEVALTWLAARGDAVTRIDLRRETAGRSLQARLRRLLAEDPGGGRIEAR